MYVCMYVCMYVFFSPCLFAQELKTWEEIECDGIENITGQVAWNLNINGTTPYVTSLNNQFLYKFQATKNHATLKEAFICMPAPGMLLHNQYEYAIPGNMIGRINLSSAGSQHIYNIKDPIESPGQLIILNDILYYITQNYLYKLELVDTNNPADGTCNVKKSYRLEHKTSGLGHLPALFNIIVLNNTIYYVSSDDGKIYSIDISGDKLACHMIYDGSMHNAFNSFTTDAQSRIWIMNSNDGVLEYNTSQKTIKKISSECPGETIFYSEAFLYCISVQGKVHSLAVGGNIPEKEKKWIEINCDGIDNISTENMSSYTDSSNQYLFCGFPITPYNFTVNETNATLSKIPMTTVPIEMGAGYKPLIQNQNNLVAYYPFLISGEIISFILIIDLTSGKPKSYICIKDNNVIFLGYGQIFLINETLYLLSYNGSLYQLELVDEAPDVNSIAIPTEYNLQYAPIEDTSLIVLKDTLYYFSKDGFCSVKISGNTVTSKLIQSVKVTDELSSLVTDENDRIWIINRTDGVIEYSVSTNDADKIAPYIDAPIRNYDRACFYSNNHLYCITNSKVYMLSELGKKKKKTKRIPRREWLGPFMPIIEGGYEFTGLAEFFAMLNDSYLSIMCNGMPMMFTFDPIMHAFHLAPKAPHFDPANSNNAFMNDRYFYVYNSDRNTITCTDTQTGMSQEIACYENMPQDIIQVVVDKNLFYILTESGENHIARMAGSNLEYVSSWKLDDWTPRTGASIVAMKNAIYVFGGKDLSDDSKEESGTCYNELYVYDFITNSSEKLEVNNDVTARYNAKIVSSKRWGKLWIIGGKDSSDSLALDVWEFNTRNKEWNYINSIPREDVNASASYDEKNDSLSLLLTPEEKTEQSRLFSMRSNTRNILQASSGAVVYQIKDLSSATSTVDQSGKS